MDGQFTRFWDKVPLNICFPRGAVSVEQMRQVFLRYMRKHPEKWHLKGIVLTVLALSDAWPCQTARAPDPTVMKIQGWLSEFGYDPGPADGFMGPRTRAAIRAFQRDHGMTVTGNPDAKFLDELVRAIKERQQGNE